MAYLSFKNWLLREFKDVFGFDKEVRPTRNTAQEEHPIKQINVEKLLQYLEMHKVGEKDPYIKFVNEIHWGHGIGAIRLWVGTGLNIMIERQTVDLLGIPKWVCKKVYQIDQTGYGGFEDAVANELLESIEKIDEKQPDYPNKDYNELESLVSTIAAAIRRTARPIFIFEGVRKEDNNSYIIRLAVRGQGVETPDQQRVEENQTHVTFDPKTGLIRMSNYNIESPVALYRWEIMPTDTDWYFCPTQSKDEIVETIANTMHWY